MRTVTLGRSGVRVTALGFGSTALGNMWSAVDDAEATAAVDAAWDAGVRYFDTAPHYGVGLAERRLGAALRERPRAEYTLSTKVGRRLVPRTGGGTDEHGFLAPATHERVWDFSADGVRRTLEASLERLGLDRVDVVLLHDAGFGAPEHLDQAIDEAFPVLAELRDQGVIGAIGAGMIQNEPLARTVRETDLDMAMLALRWTLLDQSGGRDVLPLCHERGVSVLAAAPFSSGLLARDDIDPDAAFDYGAAAPEVLDRARRIAAVCRRYEVELPQAALQFPLLHPAVVGVVVGLQTPEQVEVAAARMGRPVPVALWRELAEEGLVDVPGGATTG